MHNNVYARTLMRLALGKHERLIIKLRQWVADIELIKKNDFVCFIFGNWRYFSRFMHWS